MPNVSFLILLLIGFVDYMGIGLVCPLFAVLLFDTQQPIMPFDASPEYRGAMLGLLIGLTPLSQFFASPLLGAFSDKKGRKTALLLGIGVGCFGYILAVLGVFLNSLWLLFAYRILVGVSDATAAVAQATLADISTEENKARRFALLHSCLGLGFTVGPFIGGLAADPNVVSWFNYTTPFILAGLMSLMNFSLVLCKFHETRRYKDNVAFNLVEGLKNIRKVFVMKELQWLFVGGFAMAFGWAFFNEFVPVLLQERFEFDIGAIGIYYAVTGGCYALGGLLVARFVHLFSPIKLAIYSLLITAACMFSFAVIYLPLHIWLITPLLMGSIALAYPTTSSIVSNYATEDTQGEVLGVYQSVTAAAMGLSPLFVGSLIGWYPALAAIGGACFLMLASVSFWMGNRQARCIKISL